MARYPNVELHIVEISELGCIHVARCAINQTIQTSLGALVFQRDVLFDIPIISDLDSIQNKPQQLIDMNLIRSNKREDYITITSLENM